MPVMLGRMMLLRMDVLCIVCGSRCTGYTRVIPYCGVIKCLKTKKKAVELSYIFPRNHVLFCNIVGWICFTIAFHDDAFLFYAVRLLDFATPKKF